MILKHNTLHSENLILLKYNNIINTSTGYSNIHIQYYSSVSDSKKLKELFLNEFFRSFYEYLEKEGIINLSDVGNNSNITKYQDNVFSHFHGPCVAQ